MKILAFSDLHRDQAAAEEILRNADKADVLVGAGDFATEGKGVLDTLSILQRVTCPIVLVAGNHDCLDDLKNICSDWENGHLLHGTALQIKDVTFFGLGLETPKRSDAIWNAALSEKAAQHLLKNCPVRSVLITHTPPLGYGDLQENGRHEGSQVILNCIEDKQPVLNLCGHIHNAWGMSAKVGNCPIHNLGPTINWFDI